MSNKAYRGSVALEIFFSDFDHELSDHHRAYDALDQEFADYGLQVMAADAESFAAAARAKSAGGDAAAADAVPFPRPPASAFCLFVFTNRGKSLISVSPTCLVSS